MPSGDRTTQVPNSVTNRRLIKKLEEWGWTLHKRRGDEWEMRSHLRPGLAIKVRAPHHQCLLPLPRPRASNDQPPSHRGHTLVENARRSDEEAAVHEYRNPPEAQRNPGHRG